MGQERREAQRHSVFGGNAEITSVFGRGRTTGERARIVNWSRGGMLLKINSPRRKMVFVKQDPVVFESDEIDCVLRLAPAYKSIPVHGVVLHVVQAPKDPDHLLVGVSFDVEASPDNSIPELAKILEPRPRSGRLRKISASQKQISSRIERIDRPSSRERKKSARQARKSARLKRKSARLAVED